MMRFFSVVALLVAAVAALPNAETAFEAQKRSIKDAPILDAMINAHQAEGRSVNLSPQNNNRIGLLPRQCEYGCSCATGLNPGLYCGYCTSPRRAIPGCTMGECLDSVYQCNSSGGCCLYGRRSSCVNRQGPCNG
ncbi:hypothetical protein B0T14DRAFT_508756 [Immersiella caudata]|uniref:Uncharacterized protein n=1 Tax=Immersiella caudata TaxID=314043 RepID=A0AA40C586_9PEZI|nr:hypothetical protein B0T14DRAFT_508756 [Immersiella caudata]